MDAQTMRRRAAAAPVARMATVRPGGEPHVVVCCFAVDSEHAYSAVDQKPKRSHRLQRLENVRTNPAASLIVDHYENDWSELWWVRLDCTARVETSGRAHDRGIALLMEKYQQYRDRPPQGPVIVLRVERWTSWP